MAASRHTTGGKKEETTTTKATSNNTTAKIGAVAGIKASNVSSNNIVKPTTTPTVNTGTVKGTTKATTSTNTATPTTSTAQMTVPSQYTKQYGTDVQSQAVTNALNYLNSTLNNRPDTFQSSYETQLNDIYNKIMNREPFEYDLNTDMLYQQAKDQYTALGKLAMQDTVGQASALTGGYGNSYANTAGYQAYQGYLQGLNENIPEYYQMALDKYNQDTSDLYNQYAATGDLYDTEYGQYRDKMSDWYSDLSNAYNRYASEQALDYDSYTNAQNLAYQAYLDAQNLAYQQERDAIADAQWKSEYDLAMQEYANSSAKSSAKATAQTYSGLTDENFQLLERLASGGENKTIERWLNNWVISGKISEETAQMLMDQYYTDSEEDGNAMVSAQQFYDNAPSTVTGYRTPTQKYVDNQKKYK